MPRSWDLPRQSARIFILSYMSKIGGLSSTQLNYARHEKEKNLNVPDTRYARVLTIFEITGMIEARRRLPPSVS